MLRNTIKERIDAENAVEDMKQQLENYRKEIAKWKQTTVEKYNEALQKYKAQQVIDISIGLIDSMDNY